MDEAEAGPGEQQGGDRRAHALPLRILVGGVEDGVVGPLDRSAQVLGGFGNVAGVLERAEGGDHDLTGELAGRETPYPVGDGHKTPAREGGVLVVGPHEADV